MRLLESHQRKTQPLIRKPHPQAGLYRVFNIGNSNPTPLMDYIHAVEKALGLTAEKLMLAMQPGDVPATAADTSALEDWIGFKPNTPIQLGVTRFVTWYREFYGL